MVMTDHINQQPELLRPHVERWWQRLLERHGEPELTRTQCEQLARVVACSEFAATTLLREWPWFESTDMEVAPSERDIDELAAKLVSGNDALAETKSMLRRFRNFFLLRLLWREVIGVAELDETLQGLSLLADRLLDMATQIAERNLEARFGHIRNTQGDKVPLVILGMGKLGGRELNFSSDIDLIFCYSEAGETDGPKTVSAQEYFGRLSREIIALIDEATTDGFVFRIDTRLRPFGDSGPPVVSFAALESYLLQHGRDWERYAYIKARVVGSKPPQAVLDELYSEMICPFVYRRYLDYGVFESLREMQAMIAAEVRRRDMAENVKLGPGGIRETEFIVQALQLVRGGSEPMLQSRELQKVLPRLVSSRGLTADAVDQLQQAYTFLRRLENFVQAIRDQQVHKLPYGEEDRARLCLALGFRSWDALYGALNVHRTNVSAHFAAIAFRSSEEKDAEAEIFSRLWETGAALDDWHEALHASVPSDSKEIATTIVNLAESTAMQQADTSSRTRMDRFVPQLLSQVAQADRPSVALRRCAAVVERVIRRSAYIALLNENHAALSRFVDLCERSEYIAAQLARYPVLLDELLDPRTYTDSVTKADIAAELEQRLDDDLDVEERMRAIVQFQRATMFRIAVADFNGRLPIMKVSDGLTWLAEAVLDEALRVAWRDLTMRHGIPTYAVDGKVHEAGFGIIGYGKLGGLELSYGSDLDIVFLHNSTGKKQTTNGEKPLDNALFFGRLVRRLVHFLTTQTGSGELYEVDTRLRPDGRSGLLVTSLDGFEKYQEENAWTWEHQALLRARAVAGNVTIALEFERIRNETLIRRVRREKLRKDVTAMRCRMRKELDKSGVSTFDLKHGKGGIGDIEFLVQYLVLREAENHPGVIEFSDNIRQLDALILAGVVDDEAGLRLQDIYRDYRLQLHHLVLDNQVAQASADAFREERRFVVDTWSAWLA